MANLLEETNIGLCTVGGQVKLKVYQGTKVHVQLGGLAFVRAKEDKKQTNKQTNKNKNNDDRQMLSPELYLSLVYQIWCFESINLNK